MKIFYFLLIPAFLLNGCHFTEIPKEKLYQFHSASEVHIKNDTLVCNLNNPLECPLRIYVSTSDSIANKSILNLYPIVLRPKQDTLIKIKLLSAHSDSLKTYWKSGLGDPSRTIVYKKLGLPFCTGKSYTILQGYNGKFSHNSDYSRYALDFDLKTNDTVCAADDGFVVGVIKDYKTGGNDKRLQDYANFLTIYHPGSGLYTQYVHLKYEGSLVKPGDFVKQGQPIALAGATGWTDREHLHFNVLVPVESEDFLKSTPAEFIGNLKGSDLKPNQILTK